MNETTPQSLFKKYAEEGHRVFKDFSVTESHEMDPNAVGSLEVLVCRRAGGGQRDEAEYGHHLTHGAPFEME